MSRPGRAEHRPRHVAQVRDEQAVSTYGFHPNRVEPQRPTSSQLAGRPQERLREMGVAVIEAARAAGVEHLVFSSVSHAIITDPIRHEIKRDIEEHLLSSGLGFTILQPSNFMLPMRLRPVFEKGVFRSCWALKRYQSMVDLNDVTDVAAAVL